MNRNIPAICAAMLAFAIMFVICGGFWSADKFPLAETTDKTIYLTFDDGPSDRVTPQILDVLKEEDVKATFFIIGRQAETRKYLVKREFDEGHTVGVHSYTHKYGEIYSSPESLIKDIDRCNKLIKEVTGKYSGVYRFPGGSFGLSENLISAVTERGLKYIDWNSSTRDAEILGASPEQLYDAAITTASNTNHLVMLAHDSTTKSATAQALKKIIQHFKAEGYSFGAF